MHLSIVVLGLLMMLVLFGCQETKWEVVKSTTPEEDSKPNSNEVPNVYAIEGKFDRILVLRFKCDTDLLAGIEQIVKQQKIRNAVILSGAGSVRSVQYHSVSNRTLPSKNIFVKNPERPADLVSMNGYVIEGKVHAHMTLTDENGAFGGHLEPETHVFTFAIVTLGVMNDGVDFSRLDDKNYR